MTNVGNERMLQLSSCKKHLSSFHEHSALFYQALRTLDINKMERATYGALNDLRALAATLQESFGYALPEEAVSLLNWIEEQLDELRPLLNDVKAVFIQKYGIPLVDEMRRIIISLSYIMLWANVLLLAVYMMEITGYVFGKLAFEGGISKPEVFEVRGLPIPSGLRAITPAPVLNEEQARNLRACEEMLSELKVKYMGMWIAISGGEVVAVARTFKELAEHMKGKVVGGRAIVMKVGEHEPGRVVRGWWSGFL